MKIRSIVSAWALAVLPLGITCAGGAAAAAATPGPKPEVQRRVVLPSAVTPSHYRIDLTPDPAALTFKGTVAIDLTMHAAVTEILLNSADIGIDHAELSGGTPITAVDYDAERQTVKFRLARRIQPGAYTLNLVYHGKIYQQASGLFALDYETPSGKARALFTQFENSDARRFVPFWDEPGRKATFDLSATVPADQMALSNMPVAATQDLPDHRKRVTFATTPKMSSYLLFFGVGDFERVHRDVGGVDVGVIVKRGDTGTTAFSLDAAAQILPYYNSYFGTPYPLPKLDLIAAPGTSQFFGAMENWGAIFYFERDLLIDARISTELDKQNVYVVVAHEMAHQWFGDLVTMAWWDDLWLNEGFASWMENKVTDHFHPEWTMWLQALRSNHFAMDQDARDGTHPIIARIYDVQQASGAFDTITYSKGAAVIRMLESYLGEDAFRAGVRHYMHDHAYGNTVTDDLWSEIDQGSERPITRIAHDFTLQAGVPLVSEVGTRCVDGKTTVQITQGHFAIDPDSTAARVWHVPVMLAPDGGKPVTTVVSGTEPRTVAVEGCGAVVMNAGQTAYFMSRYSNEGLTAVASRFGALTPDDQLGLLSDTGALAYAGQEPMAALLELAKHFPVDADPIVTSALVSILRQLDQLYDGLPTQPGFRAYARALLEPIFSRVGWDTHSGESDNTALVRSSLIAALSQFRDAPVLTQARERFERYRADPTSLDAGGRRAVLRVVATHADKKTWDQLHDMARTAKTEIERQELYNLLAAGYDESLVEQALSLALSGEPPATVIPDMLDAAAAHFPERAFDFAREHWDRLTPLIEPASQGRFVPGLLMDASDLGLIAKLDAFAAQHIAPGARQDLRKSESNIRYHAAVRSQRLPDIDRWIQAQAAAANLNPNKPQSGE